VATVAHERALADGATHDTAEAYAANIENMIGTVKVPVGVIGPLRINGLHANGEFFVPLATTEAALVASYGRGADIASRAGGVTAAMLSEGVLRSPGFKFADLVDAGLFLEWIVRSCGPLQAAAEATTRHGKLVSIEPVMDNDIVFLLCRYTTGDASGQNMVTLATEALCGHIEANCPIKPLVWFVEANFSGDKKSTYLSLLTGRGRKVSASVTIPRALVEKGLHVTTERMMDYAQMAGLGALLSGQFGAQGHYANGLAALYIATGQDAACVSESAIGVTRMEARDGDLFVSVTLPNILVGSVGGGTALPSQSAALELLGLRGDGKAAALAEVAAALCLCGEISIIGAIAAGQFTQAHRKFARQR
jgi:hydroxymethylglutaryl-CoA reductase (NADPH)